ncbi:ABC transporter permease [Aerococcus sp. 1KP-2016]|uniref:ABC transporter permease n=1 Tax=Aerococcus sp. 1KP-2016 TaxID=1981982 RepID=UPI000B98A103|nr:ABC transporter permease [Aerococcus sp. 1KP-2016]OYQ67056.1 ABC transporter permease [Aerococcus sp. 1KP-2016]
MNTSHISTVIEEVYKKNVKSGTFIFLLLSPIILGIVILGISAIIGSATASESVGKVAIVGGEDQTIQAIETYNQDANELTYMDDENQAKEALTNGTIDGYLAINDSDPSNIQGKFYRDTSGKNVSVTVFQDALKGVQTTNRAANMGLTEDEAQDLIESTVAIETTALNFQKGTSERSQDINALVRQGVAYIASFIVFMFVANYISIISQEIAVEKGSRIMEIILSSISATEHFMGKMLGIFLVLLTQVAFYAVLVVGAYMYLVNTQLPAEIQVLLEGETINSLMQTAMPVIVWSLVFAFLGIVTYSVLAAFLGSLVSNVQDVNKMITPIMMLSLAGFYIGMFGMSFSNNTFVKISSHIPFFTPFVMPFRIAAETVSTGELWAAVLISLVFSIFCLWISTKFYKTNVLTYSDKGLFGTLKQSWKLQQSERASNDAK